MSATALRAGAQFRSLSAHSNRSRTRRAAISTMGLAALPQSVGIARAMGYSAPICFIRVSLSQKRYSPDIVPW